MSKIIYSILNDPKRLKYLEEKLGISKEEIEKAVESLREDAEKNPSKFLKEE